MGLAGRPTAARFVGMFASRRANAAIASATTLTLVVLAAAGAGGRTLARVHPTATVRYARASGKRLRFQVDVSFPAPGGSSAGACKGKVKLTEKAKPSAKAPHWTAKLVSKGNLCKAEIKGALPASLLDHRVSFAITFPGNGEVAPFTAVKKLKLSMPPAPAPAGNAGTGAPASSPAPPAPEPPDIPGEVYTAADGAWQGGGEGGNIQFEVKEGVIYNLSTFSSVLMRCEKKDSVPEVTNRYTLFRYKHPVPLGLTGKFSDDYTDKFDDTSSDGEIPWHIQGELGSSTGTLILEGHDGYFNEHFPEDPEYTVSECHLSITFGVHEV